MKTKYFILKDSGLHYVKDMPEKLTASGIDAAIDSSIPVANQEELFNELCKNYPLMDSSSNEGVLMELECEIRVETKCSTCGNYDRCHEFGDSGKCSELIESAFVTFPGKEETKEEAKHEIFEGCPCVVLDKPCKDNCSCVNIYSSAGCSYCAKYGSIEQRKFAAERISSALQDAVTKEEKMYPKSFIDALHGMSSPDYTERMYQKWLTNGKL